MIGRLSLLTGAVAAVALTSSAMAVTVTSDININNLGANSTSHQQMPSPYNGWNAYTGSASIWAQSIGVGWEAFMPMLGQEGLTSINSNQHPPQKINTGVAINTATNGGQQVVEDIYNLTGMKTATLDGTFTVQGQGPNQVNGGPAMMSLGLGNGVNIAIESVYNQVWNMDQAPVMPGAFSQTTQNFVGDGNYYYVLVLHNAWGDNPQALYAIKQWQTNGNGNNGDFIGGSSTDMTVGTPIWEHAVLTATDNGNNTDHVILQWNGQTVYDATVARLLDSQGHPLASYVMNDQASWGNGTAEQRSGAANLFASFTDVSITASDVVPEPASLSLLGLGALGLLARRRRA